MTKQLSIKLDDELDAEIRAAAKDGSISAWIAEAARQRLIREMWQRYAKTAEALGLNDPEWMAKEIADRDAARARATR
jgi:predicted transcriptional regulator